MDGSSVAHDDHSTLPSSAHVPEGPLASPGSSAKTASPFEIHTFPWNTIAKYDPKRVPVSPDSNGTWGLDKLVNGPDGPNGKAPYTFAILIRQAILGSSEQRLTLAGIYEAIETRYPYYKSQGGGWKNSVRHALSLNICFKKHERSAYEHGKGAYWSVDVTAKPGYKRPRKRNRGKNASIDHEDDAKMFGEDETTIDSPTSDREDMSVTSMSIDSPLSSPPSYTPCSSDTHSPAESSSSNPYSMASYSPLVITTTNFSQFFESPLTPLTIYNETPKEVSNSTSSSPPPEFKFVSEGASKAFKVSPSGRTRHRGRRKAPPPAFKVDVQPPALSWSPSAHDSYEIVVDVIMPIFISDMGLALREGFTQSWSGLSSRGFLTKENDSVPPGLTPAQANIISKYVSHLGKGTSQAFSQHDHATLALRLWAKLMWSAGDSSIGLEASEAAVTQLQGFGIYPPISLKEKLRDVLHESRASFQFAVQEYSAKNAVCSRSLSSWRDGFFHKFHQRAAVPLVTELVGKSGFLKLTEDGQLNVANAARRLHWVLWNTECASYMASAEVSLVDSRFGDLNTEDLGGSPLLPTSLEATPTEVKGIRDDIAATYPASISAQHRASGRDGKSYSSPSASSTTLGRRPPSPEASYSSSRWVQEHVQAKRIRVDSQSSSRSRFKLIPLTDHANYDMNDEEEVYSDVSSIHDEAMSMGYGEEVKRHGDVDQRAPSPIFIPRGGHRDDVGLIRGIHGRLDRLPSEPSSADEAERRNTSSRRSSRQQLRNSQTRGDEVSRLEAENLALRERIRLLEASKSESSSNVGGSERTIPSEPHYGVYQGPSRH